MANQTDRAVIDLVINGQQAQTTLKELSLEVSRARSELIRMREADNPQLYAERLANMHRLITAQREMSGRINDTSTAWGKFMANAGTISAGVLGGDVLSNGLSLIKEGFSAAINEYRAFDAASKELSAVTGATGADLDFLNKQASNTGPAFGKTGSEMLEAYKLMASAKPELLNQKELLVETTEAALTLSRAGKIDLAEATKVTAESLNQFGAKADQANRFINVIAAGAKEGSAEINEMGAALKTAGTVAAAQGVNFEQTNALLQSLSTIALKGGEAGTQLRNVLLTLGSGPDSTNPKVVGLNVALDNLAKQSLTTDQMLKLFGKDNITAAQHVLTHREQIASLTEKLTGTQEAYTQAAKNNDTYEQKLAVMNATLSKFAVIVGTKIVPAITSVVGGITDFVSLLANGLAPASEKANKAFEDQQEKVTGLTKNVAPLLTRYDELQKKMGDTKDITLLTKDEQKELTKIVGQVAKIIPSAVTQFDAYGKAMDINTGKARKAIEVQQALLEHYNKTAISETTQDRDSLLDDLKRASAKRQVGITYERDPTSMGGGFRNRPMTDNELSQVDKEIEELRGKIEERNNLIKGLSGYDLDARRRSRRGEKEPAKVVVDKPNDSGNGDGKKGNGLTDDEKKAINDKKKANSDAVLAIEHLKAKAKQDDESRELAQAKFEADQEKQKVKDSKASSELKATWIKAIEDKLLVDRKDIEEKYTKKRLEEQEKQIENLRKASIEELELKKRIKEAEINTQVVNKELTQDECEKAKLNIQKTSLEAERIINEAHYQSLIDLYQNFTDKKTKLEQEKKNSSDKIETEITENEASQTKARGSIADAQVNYDEEAGKKQQSIIKATHATREKVFNESIAVIKGFFKENTLIYKAALVAEKAWALAQVAISLKTAIVKGIAAASGEPFPLNLIAFAQTIAVPTIEAAAAVATINAQNFDVPGYIDGGFTNGESPSGFYSNPTFFTDKRYTVAENGRPEFVISNPALQVPVVADFSRMLDVAQRSGDYSGLTQSLATAGGSQTGNVVINNATSTVDLLKALIQQQELTRSTLSSKLEDVASRPIENNYRNFEKFQQRIQEIRESTSL